MNVLAAAQSMEMVLEEKINQEQSRLKEMAMENLKAAISSKDFDQGEKMAMVEFEMLSLTRHYDLMSIAIRSEILQRIDNKNLWSVLPGNYNSLEEAIQEKGHISKSEYSNIVDLTNIVFPFVRDVLKRSVVEFWDSYGKSNIREIIPYLKAIITKASSSSNRVNSLVETIYEEVDGYLPDNVDAVSRTVAAVNLLLSKAEGTNRTLRQELRAENTPPITAYTYNNGKYYITASMDEDQWLLLQRLSKEHIDFQPVSKNEFVSFLK